jgi:hypothetical protein
LVAVLRCLEQLPNSALAHVLHSLEVVTKEQL